MTADPLIRIMFHTETLNYLSRILPDKEGALAFILELMAKDLSRCTEQLGKNAQAAKSVFSTVGHSDALS